MKQTNLLDFVSEKNKKTNANIYSDIERIKTLSVDEKIEEINRIKSLLHEISPFKDEPVDCVLWVKTDNVEANDYNPNNVAPPEMELLKTSIMHDGYTQPVVTWPKDKKREVIDGFHRNRVARECQEVKERVMGYLPVVTIRHEQEGRNDRIASTIRHNRARGKHNVDSMSDIVIELKKRNWTDKRIGKELGMDEDEVLRLCQVSGLVEVFQDEDFSKSWTVNIFDDNELESLDEKDIEDEDSANDNRILHTWEEWECYPAGFYEEHPPKGMTQEECEFKYKELLTNKKEFEEALNLVITTWKNSCEHYLTNEKMNRIAWLGQASLCIKYGIPARFRGGYNLLTEEEQKKADSVALKYLNKWLVANGRDKLDEKSAESKSKANIY
jgi:ParB-like chromosome segregation protein Spo0J